MAVRIKRVDGQSVAAEASLILKEAWQPPVVHYTESYLRWQLSFPSSIPMQSFIAYDGSEPIAFGGMSARQFRCGSHVWQSAIASFAAVRPAWRHLAVGITIYKELFSAFRDTGQPFVGFGVEGGDARAVFMLVLSRVGLKVLPLGSIKTYFTIIFSSEGPASEWVAEVAGAECRNLLFPRVEDERTVGCDPADAQWEHYWADPRERAVLRLRNLQSGLEGAAWVVKSEYVARDGIKVVPTIESLYVPGYDAKALPPLFRAAARWAGGPFPIFVNAPNLSGFDPEAVRAVGVRDSGKGFFGICCTSDVPQFLRNVSATSVEVV